MSILVVALDGLDYDMIEKYNLENVKQSEYGKIDNYTGMSTVKTSELFATFITGENYRKHGVEGLEILDNKKVRSFENLVSKIPFIGKYNGIRNAIYESINSLDVNKRRYSKQDLECESIFDKISNSKALFVPSYNPSASFIKERVFVGDDLELMNQQVEKEFLFRKNKFMEEIEKDYEFLMCHFHYIDYIHHIFWELGRHDKVKEAYSSVEEFCGTFLPKAYQNFDYVILMSDHGLPDSENAHNKNAFYSCNKPLFPEREPKISDFHDKILELTGSNEDLEDLDL